MLSGLLDECWPLGIASEFNAFQGGDHCRIPYIGMICCQIEANIEIGFNVTATESAVGIASKDVECSDHRFAGLITVKTDRKSIMD